MSHYPYVTLFHTTSHKLLLTDTCGYVDGRYRICMEALLLLLLLMMMMMKAKIIWASHVRLMSHARLSRGQLG